MMLVFPDCMFNSLAQMAGTSEHIPRKVGRQTHRDNVEAGAPEQYWRTVVYYAFGDHL